MPDANAFLQGGTNVRPEGTPDGSPQARTAPGGGTRGSVYKIALALAVVATLLGLKALHIQDYLLTLVNWIRGAGWAGVWVFILAYIAATVLFLPGSILTLGAGFAYGVPLGTAVVWIAANVGAGLAFVLGRTLARDRVAARVQRHPRFAAIDRAVGREGLKIVLLTRLSPVFPFNLLNYAFGLTAVSLRDYMLGSLVGMLPGTVMYVYLGSLITSLSELAAGRPSAGAAQQFFYFAGLAATVVVTLYVTRVARNALSAAIAEAPATTNPAAGTDRPHAGARPSPPSAPLVLPDDEYNRALVASVHPRNWVNPTPTGRYNLVVIGAGTAGLVTAAGAAGLGAKVALIERELMGGDCLNVGCVPSKALLRVARAAADVRDAGNYGVQVPPGARVDFPAAMARLRRLRAAASPKDAAARFAALGVDVFLGHGRFIATDGLEVNGTTLRFRRAVIATGARASAPPITGLTETGYLTNETVFSLTQLPRRLAVIGAGPIGCELAQAFARCGAAVSVLEVAPQILIREDRDAAARVQQALLRDGIHLILNCRIASAQRRGAEKVLQLEVDGARTELPVDEILVGVGRAPNVEGLNLEAVGVAYDSKAGVQVNDRLQTTNPRIYAAGDVCAPYKFTHMADAMARLVIRNALFFGRATASALTVPWCTYTDPEIAHVGLYEEEARQRGIPVRTFVQELNDVDRAILDGETDGFVKVHVRDGTDTILGATIVARHAGEMLAELTLAMVGGVGLGTIAETIHTYPTQAEAIKKIADAYNRTRLTPLVKSVFEKWLAWSR